MKYTKTTEKKGMLVKQAIKKTYEDSVSTDKKAFIRKEIADTVFDTEDAVADNAKMISLLLTMMDRIYTALDTVTVKDLIPAADRALIEHTLATFKTTNTRADVQFSNEGIALVDKMMSRQGAIGTIVQ